MRQQTILLLITMHPRYFWRLLLPFLFLISMCRAGMTITAARCSAANFTISYGLGTPLPGKTAYIYVTNPDGIQRLVDSAENIPDHSKTVTWYAPTTGLYRFFSEYSYPAGGVPSPTVVQEQDFTILDPGVIWNSFSLPASVPPSTPISFNANVTNSGATLWDWDYLMEIRDWNGTQLYYTPINYANPGDSKVVTFNITTPQNPGVYTYSLRAFIANTRYFGTSPTVSTRIFGTVVLSSYTMSTANMPQISTNEPMPSSYRLRAKIIDGTPNSFHAATAMNNNGAALESLPAPGAYPISLYWIKYDSVGNITEIGPGNNQTVTIQDVTPPTVPTGLTCPSYTPTTITLTWNASTDNGTLSSYIIYRDGMQIGSVSSSQLSFVDQSRSPNTSYTYTVAARDSARNTSSRSLPFTARTAALGATQDTGNNLKLNIHLPN